MSGNWLATLREIEAILGEPLTPRMRLRISTTEYHRVRELVLHTPRDSSAPRSAPKAVYLETLQTPYELENWLLRHLYFGGRSTLPFGRIQSEILKYLLYYPAVAILDPLRPTLEVLDEWSQTHRVARDSKHRELRNVLVTEALRFWAGMRPSLEAGIVEVAPPVVDIVPPDSIDVRRLCSADDNAGPRLFTEAARRTLDALSQSRNGIARTVLGAATGPRNAFRAWYNRGLVYCREMQYENVPQSILGLAMLRFKTLQLQRTAPNLRTSVTVGLAAVRLPDLSMPDVRDIVAIHGDPEGFGLWRARIARVFSQIDPADQPSLQQVLDQEVPPLVDHLNSKIREYGLRRRLKTAGLAFGGTAIGAAVKDGELVTGVVSAGVGAAAALLLSLLFERPPRGATSARRCLQFIASAEPQHIPVF